MMVPGGTRSQTKGTRQQKKTDGRARELATPEKKDRGLARVKRIYRCRSTATCKFAAALELHVERRHPTG
jgi:hypothetical protein